MDEASPSTPIDIPRSNNSSPQSKDTEDAVFETGIRHRTGCSAPPEHPVLLRRATFSQLSAAERPQSADLRGELLVVRYKLIVGD